MQTALILMTILGCDDTATQCHYIERLDQRWATIQACDASSEAALKLYANVNYPVVVAVCQTPEDTGVAEHGGVPVTATAPAPQAAASGPDPDIGLPKADIPDPAVTAAQPTGEAALPDDGIASQALARFKQVLPETETLKALVSGPVHVVTDSYSWVARRFEK